MLNSVSYKISDFFIHNGKIQSEDREVFAYGIRRLILNAFMMISFMCLGFITNKLLEIGFFLVFFIPLRKYAGGFHFDNSVICYVFSCLCVLVGAYMPTLIENSGILQFYRLQAFSALRLFKINIKSYLKMKKKFTNKKQEKYL